ncbi:MAG: GNAT family protein [Chloroflexota bacterium]
MRKPFIQHENELEQPIGFPLVEWTPCIAPPPAVQVGDYCRVEPLNLDAHGAALSQVFVEESIDAEWTYLPYGPFIQRDACMKWLQHVAPSDDPLFYAIVDGESGLAVGICSYLRIEPRVGVIEVGHIHFSPLLQKKPAATEAMFLMMKRVFDELGYRRYEWKCDALNAGSRRAAERLGFTFEGIFRQATIYKKRNRDTAWFSILDNEWPRIKQGFERWLAPDNFDEKLQQKERLADLMK